MEPFEKFVVMCGGAGAGIVASFFILMFVGNQDWFFELRDAQGWSTEKMVQVTCAAGAAIGFVVAAVVIKDE